jgi:hypothetical protein
MAPILLVLHTNKVNDNPRRSVNHLPPAYQTKKH